jgi:hypothetical protein
MFADGGLASYAIEVTQILNCHGPVDSGSVFDAGHPGDVLPDIYGVTETVLHVAPRFN